MACTLNAISTERLLNLLRSGPLDVTQITMRLGTYPEFLMATLRKKGLIQRNAEEWAPEGEWVHELTDHGRRTLPSRRELAAS